MPVSKETDKKQYWSHSYRSLPEGSWTFWHRQSLLFSLATSVNLTLDEYTFCWKTKWDNGGVCFNPSDFHCFDPLGTVINEISSSTYQ